jgi:hypothetical protein
MVPSTPEHAEGEPEPSTSGIDNASSYTFAIAILILSLLSGAGLSAAYLNDQSAQLSVAVLTAE